MAQPARQPPKEDRPAETVYRRTGSETGEGGIPTRIGFRVREIAPAITPLAIGFLLLLALILLLGYTSETIIGDVSFEARDRVAHQSARVNLLLQLRLALTKLDNE